MREINEQDFFSGYREAFGPLNQEQVNGLNELLGFLQADKYITDIRWAAYMLATVKRECADQWRPMQEYGGRRYFIANYGGHTRKGKSLGNDTPEEGAIYSGKGYVQVTGERNAQIIEQAIREEYPDVVARWEARTGKEFDLTVGDQLNDENDFKHLLDPELSYVAMSLGMRKGLFTGKKLGDYIYGNTTKYVNCRRTVNGLDAAQEIADNARSFESILRRAVFPIPEIAPTVTPTQSSVPGQPLPVITKDNTDVVKESAGTIVKEVELPQPAGLGEKLKGDLQWFGGILGFSKVGEAVSGVQAWGLPATLFANLFIVAAVIGAIWLLYRLGNGWWEKWRTQQTLQKRMDINANPQLYDVKLTNGHEKL